MSSIFGICNSGKRPVSTADVTLMSNTLNHWKADDTGIWIDGPIGLGHLTLYNTPESLTEKLPLSNSVYQLSITADARIDNRDELFGLLQLDTKEGRLLPDSNLILLLYKKYGTDCIKHLIGDFAFAIWDEQQQRLFCARDHMGVKPLFYYHDKHFFAFASEKKGLLCLSGVDKSINKPFFYNHVVFPIQAADTTLYEHIHRLPPAHILIWSADKNEFSLKKYWTLDVETEIVFQNKNDYYEGLLHHFETAVQCRLRTHYPAGAQMSGGLDSSAITGAASSFLKKQGSNIITFSNTYADDSEWQKNASVRYERECMHEVIHFNGIEDAVFVKERIWNNLVEETERVLEANDGLEMWNPVWLDPINDAARQRNVRTLLSGFPGDQMVTYKGQYYYLDYLDKKQYLKYFLAPKARPFNKLKPLLPPAVEFFLHKMKNILTMNGRDYRAVFEFFKIPIQGRYIKADCLWEDVNYRERFKSYRHFLRFRILKPAVALRMEAEARFGYSFKIEPRYPMADIRLIQYCLSMPNHIKSEGEINRSAYRTAVGKYLPDIVLHRGDKTGMIAPFKGYANMQEAVAEICRSIAEKTPKRY